MKQALKEMTKTQVELHENSRKWCKTPKTQALKPTLSYADEKGHLGDPPNEPICSSMGGERPPFSQ